MADEKMTTTKKSSEEVKVEKKFCTKCGKELNEGEVCTCSTSAAPSVNVNTDAILNACKGFLDTIINMFKRPASTLKEKVSENNVKYALIMLAIIAVTYGLYIMGGFTSIITMVNGFAQTNLNDYVEIPYFKIFLYMTLINFVVSFIPIVITFLAAKITGNRDFDFKKSISLYAYSNAPMIFANLLMAVLYWLDILSWLGVIIGSVVSIACFFNYILGFLNVTNINENKKAYTLTGVIISWVVIALIAIVLLAGSLITDVTKEVNLKQNNGYSDYNDSFNW